MAPITCVYIGITNSDLTKVERKMKKERKNGRERGGLGRYNGRMDGVRRYNGRMDGGRV